MHSQHRASLGYFQRTHSNPLTVKSASGVASGFTDPVFAVHTILGGLGGLMRPQMGEQFNPTALCGWAGHVGHSADLPAHCCSVLAPGALLAAQLCGVILGRGLPIFHSVSIHHKGAWWAACSSVDPAGTRTGRPQVPWAQLQSSDSESVTCKAPPCDSRACCGACSSKPPQYPGLA